MFLFVCFTLSPTKKTGPPKRFAPRSPSLHESMKLWFGLGIQGQGQCLRWWLMMVDGANNLFLLTPPTLVFLDLGGVFGGGCFLLLLLLFHCCCCCFSVDVEFFCVAFVVWLMGCFALGNSKNPYRKFQDEIANCFETKFLVDYLWFFASGIFVGG